MRFLILMTVALAAFAACAAETGPQRPAFPFWDGEESIEAYARRAHLPPTKTLDLGNGVTMDLQPVPAGTFVMGTPVPKPVDEDELNMQVERGQHALSISVGVLLVLLIFAIGRAIREKHRPQISLAVLLVMALVAGAGLLGGLHWKYSLVKLAEEQAEYAAAVVRYNQAGESEKPAREVTIERPFYLGKYEVSQEQYQSVTGKNPSYQGSQAPNVPVNQVTWHDARAFCVAVGALTSEVVRLPQNAEWERACRAGTRTVYYTGDTEEDLDRAGWTYGNRSEIKGAKCAPPLAVGQKLPNAWGLYDMHGNVDEWCEELMGTSYRLVRGGSCHCDFNCRSAHRLAFPEATRTCYTGLRVVVDIPASQ